MQAKRRRRGKANTSYKEHKPNNIAIIGSHLGFKQEFISICSFQNRIIAGFFTNYLTYDEHFVLYRRWYQKVSICFMKV